MAKYRIRKHNKPKKRLIFKKSFWIFVLFVFALSGFCYFFFFSGYLEIKDIEISGNQKIPLESIKNIAEGEVKSKIIGIIPKNVFLADIKKIDNDILKSFPEAFKAEVKRKLFNSLSIIITERTPVASLCDNQNCFKIDIEGVAFENGKEAIVLKTEKTVSIGDRAIAKKDLSNILDIYNSIKSDVLEILISDKGKIIARQKEGWEIYFKLDDSVNEQAENLKLVLEQKIPPENRKNLEYIDLRFGNRIFFKYRGGELIDTENKD